METKETWEDRWEADVALLEAEGWTVICQSPFEINNKDGSFASGQAADIVLADLKYEATQLYSKEEMGDCFRAGYERGIFVASVITRHPIDGHYPGFDEHMKKYKENE